MGKLCYVIEMFKFLYSQQSDLSPICDAMMSISAWLGYIFEYIFWITTSWATKLGQLIDVNKGNIFLKSFEQFGGLKLISRLFWILQPAPITQESIMWSFQCLLFLKG